VNIHQGLQGYIFGSNPVAVLATLFLLSYSKLLRTIIAKFSFTFPMKWRLLCGYIATSCIYMANTLPYFLYCFIDTSDLLSSYTFLLTVGKWLQARSSQRLFYWINKPRVKPFLDAYHAPYKDKHRYWTGLLLCLHCALLLVFAFNTQADPSINLLAISSVALGLMLMTRYTAAVYRKL